MLPRVVLVSAIVVLAQIPVSAQTLPLSANGTTDASSKAEKVRSFLNRHCLECHSEERPKGKFRVDQLSADFGDRVAAELWQAVLRRVRAGEMPPKSKPRPDDSEVAALTNWIAGQMDAARRAAGRVTLRRLNRTEYENTLRDLLGVDVSLKEMLARDGSQDGFDNVGAALHLSSFALERYLEAADSALNLAISNQPAPARMKQRYSLKDQHYVKTYGNDFYRVLDDGTVVIFISTHDTVVGWGQFDPRVRGYYRFRISASGFQSAGKPVTFAVLSRAPGVIDQGLIDYFDVPADKPTVIEFVSHRELNTGLDIAPYGLGKAIINVPGKAAKYTGPGLAVHWVEAEGPLYDTWPPASHRRIFGDLPQERVPSNGDRLEVVSKDPESDAERILRAFARRALRRAVTEDDLQPFLELVKIRLGEKDTFEQAVRVGLAGILTSPQFLFLHEKPGKLDEFALASRLSYFFWSSMPDEELLALAEQKKLSQPEVLHQQVERLLKDPKAAAFTNNFCGQWLSLRDIDLTDPHSGRYPEWDHMLKVSTVKETNLFFTEILENDLSLMNFVASDFSMLNGRLAQHYGIHGVDGLWAFRRVPLPADSHRGGVLTMASVLKVTADGTNTSPVKRGAWVLERILGTPPPRPPADVPPLEPDIRGAKTLREQLAKHRNNDACATCHARIDPPGFALESFDVVGGWREYYRLSNWVDGAKEVKGKLYLQGPNVDASGETADGQHFANIDEFKPWLLRDKDQIARALTERLVTYATGGAPEASDQPEIEALVARIREKNYGLRTLVHEIVQSKLFQNK